MTSIKHTPLPWSSWRGKSHIIGEGSEVIRNNRPICRCKGDYHFYNNYEANAEFIIKACNSYYDSQATIASQEETIRELVEVLEDCVEYSSLSEEYRPIPNTERELMEDIESAISKAKGQTDEK